jgi:phospholipase/carboxylesterase
VLACDTALASDEPFAALAILSGCVFSAPAWREAAARHRGLRVLVAHGRADDKLALERGEAVASLLAASGAHVETCWFEGGHEVPDEVVARVCALAC